MTPSRDCERDRRTTGAEVEKRIVRPPGTSRVSSVGGASARRGGIAMSCQLFGYSLVWLLGLAAVGLSALRALGSHEEAAPSFEFGAHVSVVSIRAANGMYVEVSRDDGLLRATARTADSLSARFRVHVRSSGPPTRAFGAH